MVRSLKRVEFIINPKNRRLKHRDGVTLFDKLETSCVVDQFLIQIDIRRACAFVKQNGYYEIIG